MISQQSIQQILSQINIIDVIGGFVKLKKRGANFLGLCPFHNERTPSFTVSPAKEIYKCFGCGRSGNTISFLMENEKLSYVEALKWLANRYNIEVEETDVSPEVRQLQQVTESLYIINDFAKKFFAEQLFETEEGKNIGLPYLKDRGFNESIMQKFGLGYALDKKDAFTKVALSNQYNAELLQKSGLVVKRNDQWVDNYRDRIIFPIHNSSGKIIGFGARLIKSNEKAPKYINTPENELYVKSKILYGIYFARQSLDKNNECLLVEGYTDVLSLHQAGIENVVASGGTSLTQDQLRLIKKYTKNLTIIYDGDTAGVKAALRGLDMALDEGLNVKLVLIPDGEDPDSYLQKLGTNNFKAFIQENKKDFVLFLLDFFLKDAGTDANRKSEVVNQVAETISKIDRAEDFTKQQDYIRQCSQILKIDETGFTTLVNKFIRNRISIQEKRLPFEEAKFHAENAGHDGDINFDDQTFNLLFRDELQEREIARILLEHGTKQWNDSQLIAEYVLSELPDEDLIQNESVLKLINAYKNMIDANEGI
ncbi:MAG TPA: DNA primase, partial [Chitinophagaceae bacterium]|nr:DNA primase [Chitinophagaceae bacterium]